MPRCLTTPISLQTCPGICGKVITAAYETETPTPGYVLLGLSVGTDIRIKGRKAFELHLIADNITNTCYQEHLSRLKYADVNVVTGLQGVFNMGRNFVVKAVVPIGENEM